MFNLGFSEVLVVVAVVVLLFRPKDFQKVARKAGRMLGTFREYKDTFMREIDLAAQLKESGNKTPDGKKVNEKEAEKEAEVKKEKDESK